jgi:hypothetical protein
LAYRLLLHAEVFNFYLIYVKIDGVSNYEFRLTPPEKSSNWSYSPLALPSVLKTI